MAGNGDDANMSRMDEYYVPGQASWDWSVLRTARDLELKDTDWWACKDVTMSQAKKDYRTFLRDLPQTYSTADEAADAWSAYEIPE